MKMGAIDGLKQLLTHQPAPSQPIDPRQVSSVIIVVGWNSESESDEILLTKRTQTVETHKGQISFPGGFYESHDTDLLRTALRELEEECGAISTDVEILGGLPPVYTQNNVQIYPWVGTMRFPYSFQINPHEVEKLLYLPVSQLVGEGLKPVTVPIGSYQVKSIGLNVENELVWGATAKILEHLRGLLLTLSP